MQTREQRRQLSSEQRFVRPQLFALDEREDRDDAAAVDVERRAISPGERRDHLLDLLRQELKERVLPPHALGIGALDPNDDLAGPNQPSGRAANKRLATRRQLDPVPLAETFGESFETWLRHPHPCLSATSRLGEAIVVIRRFRARGRPQAPSTRDRVAQGL